MRAATVSARRSWKRMRGSPDRSPRTQPRKAVSWAGVQVVMSWPTRGIRWPRTSRSELSQVLGRRLERTAASHPSRYSPVSSRVGATKLPPYQQHSLGTRRALATLIRNATRRLQDLERGKVGGGSGG
jgi:hypothetical protein